MDGHELHIDTGARLVVDITAELRAFCDGRGDGLCHVFAPHATAGLALMETGSGSESDLAQIIDKLFPRDDRYRHRHGSAGHGADHVMPAFVSPSLVLAVSGGEVTLGAWQSVVLVDPNTDNPVRRVLLHFLADAGGGGPPAAGADRRRRPARPPARGGRDQPPGPGDHLGDR